MSTPANEWIDEQNRPQMECHECNGLGYVNCFCGGDMCVCGIQELPCHTCYPGHYCEEENEG